MHGFTESSPGLCFPHLPLSLGCLRYLCSRSKRRFRKRKCFPRLGRGSCSCRQGWCVTRVGDPVFPLLWLLLKKALVGSGCYQVRPTCPSPSPWTLHWAEPTATSQSLVERNPVLTCTPSGPRRPVIPIHLSCHLGFALVVPGKLALPSSRCHCPWIPRELAASQPSLCPPTTLPCHWGLLATEPSLLREEWLLLKCGGRSEGGGSSCG